MGRNRTKDMDLPPRLYYRGRAYHYVSEGCWHNLGTNRPHATSVAEKLNRLSKKALRSALRDMTHLDRLVAKQDTRDEKRRKQERWSKPYQSDRCVYCGNPADVMDHFIPKSIGGSDEPCNLVSACASCNNKKSAIHPLEFIADLVNRGEWPTNYFG